MFLGKHLSCKEEPEAICCRCFRYHNLQGASLLHTVDTWDATRIDSIDHIEVLHVTGVLALSMQYLELVVYIHLVYSVHVREDSRAYLFQRSEFYFLILELSDELAHISCDEGVS